MGGRLASLAQVTSTELGREWLVKALNPTEPSIAAVGMPDGTAVDTVCLELTTSFTVNASTMGFTPASPLSAPWGMKVLLTPHMIPGSIIPLEGASSAAPIPVRYPIFENADIRADYSNLTSLAEAWRLCGQSVTIHLDANSTKDSGTIVAAQQVTKPQVMFPGMSATGYMQYPLLYFQEGTVDHADNPDYTTIMALPRAYQSNLRTGLYMPLKLNSTCQHWSSARESVIMTAQDSLAGSPSLGGLSLTTAALGPYPFPHYAFRGPIRSALNNTITGWTSAGFLGDTWGHIAVSGVDPSSGVVLKFRSLLELKVQARSSYAPHMRPAPFPDHMAIQNYFTIVRELPDAYPADYNDAGKIMGVIGKAIRTVSPFLTFIPGVGKALTAAAGPISGALITMGKDATEARKAFKAKGGKGKRNRRRAVAGAVAKGALVRVATQPQPKKPN